MEQPRPPVFTGRSIRVKLQILLLGLSSIAVGVSFFAFLIFNLIAEIQRLERDVSTLGQVLENVAGPALLFQDPKTARDALVSLETDRSVLLATLYQKDGKLFSSYQRIGQQAPSGDLKPEDRYRHRRLGRYLEVVRPIQSEGDVIGWVYLKVSLIELYERVLQTLLGIVAGLGISVGIIYLISSRLQRGVSGPILDLAAKAAEIAEKKDYALRVTKQSDDELGYLAESFNAMLVEIQSRDGALRQARDGLELRVAERTEELLQEIAERKLAAQQLKESEEISRAISTSAQDGIIMINELGRVSFWNKAAETIFGYTAGEAIGANLHQMIAPPEMIPAHQAGFSKFVVSGQGPVLGKMVTLEGVRKNQTRVSVELSLASVKLRGQWHAVGVVRDITERQKAEEQLARLGLAIEQSNDVVVITDVEGGILYVNPAANRVTGYAAEELLGQKTAIFKSGKHGREFYRQLWDTILSGRTWNGRLINRKKDGSLYEEEAAISPVRDSSGKITNFVAVKRDVTRETMLQEQMTWAQRMDAVGRLAGGIAHDFNNLLAVVLNYANFVAEELPPDSSLRADLEEIRKAAQRGAAMNKQLLTFSRKQMVQAEVIDLGRPLRDMENLLRRQLGENIELLLSCSPDLWRVEVDTGQFEQVLMNMVVNARDAMPAGGKLLIDVDNFQPDAKYLELRPDVSGGRYVRLVMRDTGCGMSEEVAKRIFEPFFTTKEKGKGTGLGLATVYGIIKQANGHIWVESELGSGSIFTVLIPATDKGQVQAAAAAETATPTVAKRGEETILVVEDEDAVRELTRRILAKNGYQVFTAGDAGEAMAIEEKHGEKIDLLLTDVVMPKVTGPELAKQLVQIRPKLRVLYMTGYADNVLAQQGAMEKIGTLLRKPFTEDVLLQRIREILDASA